MSTIEMRSARILLMTKKNTYLKMDKDKEIYYLTSISRYLKKNPNSLRESLQKKLKPLIELIIFKSN